MGRECGCRRHATFALQFYNNGPEPPLVGCMDLERPCDYNEAMKDKQKSLNIGEFKIGLGWSEGERCVEG
jgi:hypothetical protein